MRVSRGKQTIRLTRVPTTRRCDRCGANRQCVTALEHVRDWIFDEEVCQVSARRYTEVCIDVWPDAASEVVVTATADEEGRCLPQHARRAPPAASAVC
jgi:hypothetical protein